MAVATIPAFKLKQKGSCPAGHELNDFSTFPLQLSSRAVEDHEVMVSRPPSKAELLAAARAMLREDDRERREESQRLRRNEILIAIILGSILCVAAGFFVASCHSANSNASHGNALAAEGTR
jgi:hypothetical protein